MLGFVLLRLRGRLSLAAAVLLTVLITTTVLTTLFAFNRSVADAGLRRSLGNGARATVLVTVDHTVDTRAKDDADIARFGQDLFGGLPVTVQQLARSRSYGLPSNGRVGGEPDLTVLAALDRDRVKLLAGQWPAPAAAQATAQAPAAPVETAVPESSLQRLGLTAAALPAPVELSDRYGGRPITVRITGVYRAADRTAPYWRLEPLGGREIQAQGFTTFGPMLVDDSAFGTGRLPQGSRGSLLTADFTGADPDRADQVGRRAAAARTDFMQQSPGMQVNSELTDLMAELHAATLVTRSGLLTGALQLAVLAGAALLLVVHLVSERQAGEGVLLTARGATRGRLALWTAVEALLLALPAAVLAPLLTGPLLRLLSGFGPLAGLPLDTADVALRWPTAAACALICVVLIALPSMVRESAGNRVASRRQALVGTVARSGADLALLALAVLAYQQLSGRTGGLSVEADGQLGIDPVLVAAPTLALGAGTLLVLRVLPFAARLGARAAAVGRGLGPALAGWQLARRPGRANGPVLLLVLAVATGVLALGQHTSWRDSQRDQSDFDSAGGLRISASALPPIGHGRYATLPGGERLLPVARTDQYLPGDTTGRLLLTDTAKAAAELTVRPDLFGHRPPRDLLAPLGGAQSAGVLLPGRPARIDLTVDVHLADRPQVHNPFQLGGETVERLRSPDLWLLLRDGLGTSHRIPLPRLPSRGEATVPVDLGALTAAPLGSVAAPLTVTGLAVSFDTGYTEESSTLTVRRIGVSDTPTGPATPVQAPAGAWTGKKTAGVTLRGEATPERLLELAYSPNDGTSDSGRITVLPAGSLPAANELKGLATRTYLDAVGAQVGQLIQLQIVGAPVPVRITAAVDVLPVAGTTGIVLDLDQTTRWLLDRNLNPPPVTEWWLPAAGPDDRAPAEAAAALRAGPAAQQLTLREEATAARTSDPLNAAPQSALIALALVSAVLAAIGFGAAAAASAGERAAESAVLLALGTPRRLLNRAAFGEQIVLVGIGTAVGAALGAVLVHLVVPLLVLTPAARPPLPEVLVALPLGQLLALAAATAALPLLSAFLVGGRRRDVAARLRFVEDK
ncbi:ABC transporter permease [Kitasatospora sp. NPDC002040]|uniref:ABC transporter permease n=1 Tax=Kitasatospora sp. NPDC002040 TaxID=3154661 RepID=UPI003320959D